MVSDYCVCCQKVTIHNKEKVEWFGNFKMISVRLICTECNSQNSMWLEEKEIKNNESKGINGI